MSNRWPALLGRPAARARIRASCADFRVEEIPAYPPCGHGEHLLVEVEKTDLTTDQLVRALARHTGVRPAEVGTAGLKDRRAVTRQWLSLPARAADALDTFDQSGIRLLRAERHTNKLKTGHLRGNRFGLRLRELNAAHHEAVVQRAERLAATGVPNYFGPQRFGRGGDNEAEGRAVLRGRGRRHDRRGLRFVLNAVQSGLFNDLLALRIHREVFDKALAGDLLIKADSGGRFICREPAVDQARADRLEVHPSGPMFGPRMRWPEGEPAVMERRVLAESGLSDSDWRRFAKLTPGTRRPLRFTLIDLRCEEEDGDLWLHFTLPAGAYATAVLGELIQAVEGPAAGSADGPDRTPAQDSGREP
jgi:tRNA pseudouridine13 synthase